MKAQLDGRRQHLGNEIASVLPVEGSAYFAQLQRLRFTRTPHARYTFLRPETLVDLLMETLRARGNLAGDDRRLMQMSGVPTSAFRPDCRYLRVPAEGRVASMNIEELPEWVPVTVQNASELPTDPSGRALDGEHLSFSVDADFQRQVNFATVVLAPNWFLTPSTEWAILDVFPGAPSHGLHSLPRDHHVVRRLGLTPGQQVTVGAVRKHLRSEDGALLMGCCLRNMPGS